MVLDADILKASSVMVVGCGALGNEVLKNLVLVGIGHLVLVDFDYVEESNLTRSILFRKNDVGRRKVDAASERLLEINPDLKVETIFGDVAYDVGLGLFRDMDVVVGCVDSRWARYCIQRNCLKVGKTWVDGGILELEGTVRIFAPGRNCYACSLGPEGLAELRRRVPCSGLIRRKEAAGHAPTTPIAAGVIGAVQAQEAVKVILGAAEEDIGRMFYYDGEHLSVRTVSFEAWDDDCELHGDEYAPVVEGNVFSTDTPVSETVGCGALVLNDPFVDYVVNATDGKRTEVMVPARKVEDYVANDPELRRYPSGVFRTHEWDEITGEFPYRDVTLGRLGIPSGDILKFRIEKGYYFIGIQ